MSIRVCSILKLVWFTAGNGRDQIKFLHRIVVLALAVKGHATSDLSGCKFAVNCEGFVGFLNSGVVLAFADEQFCLSNNPFELDCFRIFGGLDFCRGSGLPPKNRLNVSDKQQSHSDNQSQRLGAHNSATHSHS